MKGSNRVNRGGSWNNNAENCTVSYRNNNSPDNRNNNIGFRVALSQFKNSEDTDFLTIVRFLSLIKGKYKNNMPGLVPIPDGSGKVLAYSLYQKNKGDTKWQMSQKGII